MISVCISYARADKAACMEIVDALKPLQQREVLKVWTDASIAPGMDFSKDIETAIVVADIIMVLASASYFISKFCGDIELPLALEQRERRGACVFPVIVDDCPWKTSKLSTLQVFPTDGAPLSATRSREQALQELPELVEAVAVALADFRDAAGGGHSLQRRDGYLFERGRRRRQEPARFDLALRFLPPFVLGTAMGYGFQQELEALAGEEDAASSAIDEANQSSGTAPPPSEVGEPARAYAADTADGDESDADDQP